MMNTRLLAILIIAIFPACTEVLPKQSAGSGQLSAQDYFLKLYQQDTANAASQSLDQYLLWVNRFYQGWEFYPSGWNSVTYELMTGIKNPEIAEQVNKKLEQLGRIIAGEWAKDNSIRLINTRHISIWGNALLKSLSQGETLDIIGRIFDDIDGLLTHRISANVITENRFYVEEDIFKEIN